MTAFDGKWTLIGGENVEAFYDAIHTPPEFKAKMRTLAVQVKVSPDVYIEEMHVDKAAGKVHRAVYIKGEKKREGEVSLGSEHNGQTPDGRPCKIWVKLENDSKLVRIEKGIDFESRVTLEVIGNELVVTQCCGGVKAVEKFRRH